MRAHRSAWGQKEKATEHYQVCVCTSGRSPAETIQWFLTEGFSSHTNSVFPLPTTPFPSEITTPQHPQNAAGTAGMPREHDTFQNS